MKCGNLILGLGCILVFGGCASKFPVPTDANLSQQGPSAEEIFQKCLASHGGDLKQSVREVHLEVTGEWGTLIQRIQPLVTDSGYRIRSDERHFIQDGRSIVEWEGPEGTKRIVYAYPDIEVYYDGVQSNDPDVLASTALTTAAFRLFHLGPSYLAWQAGTAQRLQDEVINGRNYHRLYYTLEPGFGFSEMDTVIAYVDAENYRLFRVWITLNGFKTTVGASVDVTFLDYREVDGFLLPSRFDERVRAPISIHAHEWHTTTMEITR